MPQQFEIQGGPARRIDEMLYVLQKLHEVIGARMALKIIATEEAALAGALAKLESYFEQLMILRVQQHSALGTALAQECIAAATKDRVQHEQDARGATLRNDQQQAVVTGATQHGTTPTFTPFRYESNHAEAEPVKTAMQEQLDRVRDELDRVLALVGDPANPYEAAVSYNGRKA
jgi:hypothetical protein